jgi:DNA-binding transcriptional LysR family regulator
MWQTVELREVRVFLTLAEELHFGRTAERLQVTPSRVSQSLRGLEHKLGAQLVHRTSRRVQLTPLGKRFLADVRPAYDQLTGVLQRTNAAARSLEGTLRLGLLSRPAGGPQLVEIIGAFEALHPECKVEVVQMSWDDPFGPLREGEIEVMASWTPLKQPDLVVGPTLTRQPRVLAVARDHPLAERDSVDVEELADHRVVRFEGWPKELDEGLVPFRTPGGRPIPWSRFRVGERSVLDVSVRVARGEFVFVTVASAVPHMAEFELAFVPITGMPPFRSALVWRRPVRDPKLREFLGVARAVLQGSKKPATRDLARVPGSALARSGLGTP